MLIATLNYFENISNTYNKRIYLFNYYSKNPSKYIGIKYSLKVEKKSFTSPQKSFQIAKF